LLLDQLSIAIENNESTLPNFQGFKRATCEQFVGLATAEIRKTAEVVDRRSDRRDRVHSPMSILIRVHPDTLMTPFAKEITWWLLELRDHNYHHRTRCMSASRCRARLLVIAIFVVVLVFVAIPRLLVLSPLPQRIG
jgi:hypothetical protein